MKNVLFLVDTSGSMYNERIVSANAVLKECIWIIRERIKSGIEINVYYSSFDEEMKNVSKLKDVMKYYLPDYVLCDDNGYFKLTNFSRLYDGLLDLYEGNINENDDYMIVIITDGKTTDVDGYEDRINRIRCIRKFRDSIKLVAVVNGDVTTASRALFEFVDNDANNIFALPDLPNRIDSHLI